MSKEKKQPLKEINSKRDKKNIFLFTGLILISGFAAIYLIKNKPSEKKQSFNIDPIEENLTNDSILIIDTNNLNQIEVEQLIVIPSKKKTNKKASRFSIENNPKYWIVVNGSNSDTSFYLLKNIKTGTKLSNKFYSKEKANVELKNLRSILVK
jgi:hypothetical protein